MSGATDRDRPGQGQAYPRLHDARRRCVSYNIGVLHSPERKSATRLLRIEGLNMDRVKRRPYEAVDVVIAAAE